MRALEPVGIEAALAALTARERNDEAAIRLAQSALAEARYQAERAEAQFDAVEPANQNVFHNLARKWEATCLGSETVKPGCRPWRGQGTGKGS